MMKIRKIGIAAMACLLFLGAVTMGAGIGVVHTYAADTTKNYVVDNADILTEEEEQKLQKQCEKASKNSKADIVILTIREGLDYAPLDEYVWKFLQENYDYDTSNDTVDAVCYVVDMKSRADRIIAGGTAKKLTTDDIKGITDAAEKKLANGNYYGGFKVYTSKISGKINPSIGYLLTWNVPIRLLISLGVAVIVVVILLYQAKSKMTVDNNTYTKDHQYHVRAREDRFTHTTTVTRHIEKSSGSSGRSGGSSGGSYSSGGGHF